MYLCFSLWSCLILIIKNHSSVAVSGAPQSITLVWCWLIESAVGVLTVQYLTLTSRTWRLVTARLQSPDWHIAKPAVKNGGYLCSSRNALSLWKDGDLKPKDISTKSTASTTDQAHIKHESGKLFLSPRSNDANFLRLHLHMVKTPESTNCSSDFEDSGSLSDKFAGIPIYVRCRSCHARLTGDGLVVMKYEGGKGRA